MALNLPASFNSALLLHIVPSLPARVEKGQEQPGEPHAEACRHIVFMLSSVCNS
jgi:hypothetical protein